MDLGLTDKSSEETGYLQTGNGSDFIGKLDLNLAASKDEESGEVYNDVHVDLNQLENQGSNVSAASGGGQGHGSPPAGPISVQATLVSLDSQHSSPVQPEPSCDDMDRANFASDLGKLQSSPIDNNSKVEIVDSEAKSKIFQDELETRDFAVHSKYGHDESQKEYSDSCSRKLPLHDIEMTENTSQLEKSRLASQETEGENDGREDFEFSSRTTYTSEEMKVEADIGMMEGMKSDPPKNMTSPLKVQGLSYSLDTSKQKLSPPEKSSLDGNGVSSHEHFSPSNTRNKPSRSRMSQSPRRQNLSPGHQRQGRSPSRSPVLHRDSSAHNRRDYRERSRSRSPYTRDRYRRSPRRRHSPRHRSPPPRYHSNRPFPRGRPWSPPHNRNTGVGRPGKNLFVAGFSFITTEKDLERKFSRFGRVTDVRIVRDKRSGDSRGFGFLSLERDEDADAAIRALDQTEWNGRIVLVEKSKTSAR